MFCPHSRVDTSTSAQSTTKFRAGIDRFAHRHAARWLPGFDVELSGDPARESSERTRLGGAWLDRERSAPSTTTGHDQTASILECAAITLAAGVLTEQQLATARQTNELLRQSSHSSAGATATSLARRFHDGLIGACPNAHMVALLQSQTAAGSTLQQTSYMTTAAIRRAADDHDEILELIERGASSRTIERFISKHMAESVGCFALR